MLVRATVKRVQSLVRWENVGTTEVVRTGIVGSFAAVPSTFSLRLIPQLTSYANIARFVSRLWLNIYRGDSFTNYN